uniref:Uncharacterized protein n=1 Tax=Oryza brachyantha TaxID=4533 RepID=J3LQ75_ORYBR
IYKVKCTTIYQQDLVQLTYQPSCQQQKRTLVYLTEHSLFDTSITTPIYINMTNEYRARMHKLR